jgi:hypothetical protein
MDADAIALLRAQAKSSGGDWIGLQEVGDWFAGTVADPSHQTVTTDFGDTEELLVENVTINDVPQGDGTLTFRLSRKVLKDELGSDADEAPDAGWSVYVVYRGARRSANGREYHNYDVAKKAPDLEAAQATAKKKSSPKAAKADGDDIPF